jgi:hypothetical protein
MTLRYEGRVFRSVANSEGGDVGGETMFHYHQEGDTVWATYSGGAVRFGTLVAKVDALGNLDVRYHHVAADGRFKSGPVPIAAGDASRWPAPPPRAVALDRRRRGTGRLRRRGAAGVVIPGGRMIRATLGGVASCSRPRG